MIEAFSTDDPAMGVACLERYRELLAEPDACAQPGLLWLVPTPRRERQVLEGLRPASGRALFGAGVQTFEQLAEVILASAGASGKLISPAMQRVILRRVIARRLSTGELVYFKSIAGTSGFADVVAEWISELKRGETWPDDLARAIGRSRRGEGDSLQLRDQELLQIYRDYQAQLEQRDWYDYEGRFWRARTLLTGGETHFQQFRLVVLDGFSSLSATQVEMVAWLIEHSQVTFVGWPGRVDDRGLPEFHGPKQLLKQLEGHLTDQPVFKPLSMGLASDRPARPSGLSLVQQQLFNETAIDRVGRDASRISIQMLAGQESERSHVARQVKKWLQAGKRPSEIVIAVRSLDTDGEALFQACQSAGIPVYLDQPARLSRSAVVKAVRALLRLEAGDWAFSELQRVLDHALVRPVWKTAESVTQTLTALRQLQLHEGREVILKVIDRQGARYAEMAANGSVSVSASGARFMAARQVLHSLSDALKPLRSRRTLEEWVNALEGIVAELRLVVRSNGRDELGDISPAEAALDRADWELFQRILRDAADAEGMNATKLELTQFLTDIEDLLRIERMPRRPQPKETVAIVDVKQAQHLRVKCLLLPGLVESSFPQRGGDNCLYSEAERASLNERGVQLRVSIDRVADEQLLFFRLMSACQEELVLCYGAIDQRGQGVFPSPYLTAVEQLFEAGVLPIEGIGQLDPVPPMDRMTLRSEIRLATVRGGLAGNCGPLKQVLEDQRFAGWAYRLEGQLELGISRFETTGWTAYEGDCSSPLALTELARRYPAGHEFSVSQFEQYASCPFQFFAQRVLGIDPLGDVQPGGSALDRGIHLHEVLSRIDFKTLHQHLDSEAIHAQLSQLLDGYFNSHGGGTQLQGALLRIERQLLDAYSSRFGVSQVEFAKQLSTMLDGRTKESLTELAFGRLPGEASVGTAAGLPAIQFGNVGEVVHVCGKVDRIDVFESAGEKSFVIIDYKTGKVKEKRFDLAAIASGQSLQMIVYLLALKRLEVFGADARPAMMIYWGLGEEGPVGGFKRGQRDAGLSPLEEEILTELETLVDEVLPRLALGIRQGLFTVSPQQKDCTQHCDYRHACRIAQVRSVAEVLGKTGFNG